MLPTPPRHPILLGGIIAPVLWTGVLHSALPLINPFLAERIDWGWFVVSQVTFWLVAGWVVSKQYRHPKRVLRLLLFAWIGHWNDGRTPSGGRTEVTARFLKGQPDGRAAFGTTVLGCRQLPAIPSLDEVATDPEHRRRSTR